ncbi:transposase [Saccharopolyspora shandongensis]|uniref:transposase n=1 Tax=Saccharopolyspora shandongensis TaxID=418495 RepID=UPI0033D22086
MVNRMAGGFHSEAKSDAKDARVIAEDTRVRSDLTELSTSEDLVVVLVENSVTGSDLAFTLRAGIR